MDTLMWFLIVCAIVAVAGWFLWKAWLRSRLVIQSAPPDVVALMADQYTALAEVPGETLEEKRRRVLLTMELPGVGGTMRGQQIEAELAELNRPKWDRINR